MNSATVDNNLAPRDDVTNHGERLAYIKPLCYVFPFFKMPVAHITLMLGVRRRRLMLGFTGLSASYVYIARIHGSSCVSVKAGLVPLSHY